MDRSCDDVLQESGEKQENKGKKSVQNSALCDETTDKATRIAFC
jgi:hypothetical protein